MRTEELTEISGVLYVLDYEIRIYVLWCDHGLLRKVEVVKSASSVKDLGEIHILTKLF